MADTAVAITAGSGTNIDTRTEGTNGNHRQVVVLGDPATNAGVAPVDATAGLKVDLGADNDVTVTSGTITAVTAITNALPAGTNAIGKLAENSGVDIGDVDVTSCALPTGASTSAKQDTGNTSIASIDTKVPALGQALAAASVPVVLTAAQITTLTPPAAITGFSTSAKQDTEIASLASIDGKITAVNTGAVVVASSALPSGASTAAKQPALGTAGTASTDVISVQGIASMTALKVDGSGVTQPVSGTVSVTSLQTDALTDTQLRATAVPVSLASVPSHAVTNAGTFATQATLQTGSNAIGKLTSNTGVTIGAIEIASAQTLATVTTVGTVTTLTGGAVAHDGADSGNPLKIGGRAVSAEITAVANNDRSDFVTDLVGKQIVLPYANPENFVSGCISSAMTSTTSTSLIAAPASGLRNYITQITVSNTHATVGTNLEIQDGNGGTTYYIIPAAAVYGGATLTFPTPLRQPTTATAVYIKNTTTGASTFASASGYKGA